MKYILVLISLCLLVFHTEAQDAEVVIEGYTQNMASGKVEIF